MFSGKCLKKDTNVLCFDGSIKKVQDICNGDLLMGDDSLPRTVSDHHNGVGRLYTVSPTRERDFEPYTVNEQHILSLMSWENGEIIDIPILDYLKQTTSWKQLYKGYQTYVEFPKKKVIITPHLIGEWIVQNFWSELAGKRIPEEYLCNDRETRLQVLSGILCSSSIKKTGAGCCTGYFITIKDSSLQKDVLFLARSLGYRCSHDLENMHIDQMNSNAVLSSITVTETDPGEYFGFTVDGNNRFLLADFTVTHNSSALLRKLTQLAEMGLAACYINHGIDNRAQTAYSTHSPLLQNQELSITTMKTCDLQALDMGSLKKHDVIGIDEAQFFDESLISFVRELVDVHNKYVIVVGLDGNFRREKFGHILDLIPLADNVTKLHAYCKECAATDKKLVRALFTHYTAPEKDVENTVIVGGAEKYQPVCRNCYLALNIK